MTPEMVWTFWISVAFIVYSMVGYAGCLWLLSLVRRKVVDRAPMEPTVSILIVVRGGERLIEAKLRNCLEQDYPCEKVDIVVVCDGAAPETEAIVERYAAQSVKLIRAPRQGKNGCLALALGATSGEMVVFTDAAVMMDSNALCLMAENFADPRVGCVSSEDATDGAGINAEPMYVEFDARVRRLECAVGSMIASSGSLFAARRAVCAPWPKRMSSDFFVPLNCIQAGYDVVVDIRVRGYLKTVKVSDEFFRKVRTIVHGIDVLFEYRGLLNPFRYGLRSWELFSHKLCRWLLPLAFLGALVSSAFLWSNGWVYQASCIAQCVFYAAGAAAWLIPSRRTALPLKVARFFVMSIAATALAWVKFFSGEYYVTWEPSRR